MTRERPVGKLPDLTVKGGDLFQPEEASIVLLQKK